MKIIEKVVNVQTGEEQIFERDMTAQEIAEFELNEKKLQAELKAKEEAQAKRGAALAKLEALGLDEDDLKALGL